MTKCLTTPADLKQLGTILSIWAHPDDESFMAAGIMAAAVKNGQTVVCVTATKGEAGVQDESRWPAARLGEIRAQEMSDGLKLLGVRRNHWLGYPDGGCKDMDEAEAVAKIVKLIDRYQPASILTFGADGITGHDDHRTVSRWVDKAAKNRDVRVYQAAELPEIYEKSLPIDEKFNFFFNIDKPPLTQPEQCAVLLRLSPDLLKQKYQCLCAMPSQTENMFKELGEETICEMLCAEAFVAAKPAK